MDKLIKEFCEIQEYIKSTIVDNVECFMTNVFDPISKYIIIRETELIIRKDVMRIFPKFPEQYIPRVKFKIYDEYDIEVGVQNFITNESGLIFLGTNQIEFIQFDYYMRESWDPRFKYMFIARYGHEPESNYTGSKVAEADYTLGNVTPLSVAYSMALSDGFIE